MAMARLDDLSSRPCDPWGGLQVSYVIDATYMETESEGVYVDLPSWAARMQLAVNLFLQGEGGAPAAPTMDDVAGLLCVYSLALGGSGSVFGVDIPSISGTGLQVSPTVAIKPLDGPQALQLGGRPGQSLRLAPFTVPAPHDDLTPAVLLSLTFWPDGCRP